MVDPQITQEAIEKIRALKKRQFIKRLLRSYTDVTPIGRFLIVENKDTFRAIYSLDEQKFITDFVFTQKWHLMPNTIGNGLVGAYNQDNDIEHIPLYVFLELANGNVAYKLPEDMRIIKGFSENIPWTALIQLIDKNGNRRNFTLFKDWRILEISNRQNHEEPEEEWDDPFLSNWNDGYDSYMDGEADSYFYD